MYFTGERVSAIDAVFSRHRLPEDLEVAYRDADVNRLLYFDRCTTTPGLHESLTTIRCRLPRWVDPRVVSAPAHR
jgi:hypothetical protein